MEYNRIRFDLSLSNKTFLHWFACDICEIVIVRCTGCVAQWLERPTVKGFSSRCVGLNPTVKALNKFLTVQCFSQSTQL